jgi:hypothetical protein
VILTWPSSFGRLCIPFTTPEREITSKQRKVMLLGEDLILMHKCAFEHALDFGESEPLGRHMKSLQE